MQCLSVKVGLLEDTVCCGMEQKMRADLVAKGKMADSGDLVLMKLSWLGKVSACYLHKE